MQISAAFVVKNLLDSKTRTTSSTRFPHKVMHARESASIWRENVVAVVILSRIFRQRLHSIAQKEVAGAQRF